MTLLLLRAAAAAAAGGGALALALAFCGRLRGCRGAAGDRAGPGADGPSWQRRDEQRRQWRRR